MRNCFLTLLLLFSGLLKAQDIDVLHYAFRLSLGDENDTISGITNITFVIKNDAKTVSLDLASVNKDGKGMHALLVTDEHQNAAPLLFTHTDGKVSIQVPQAKRNDTCNVSITYHGVPADGLIISKNKFGERTFFSDNWPNRAHHWIPCVDRPDDKASFEFVVAAPSHYQVISNGTKTEEKNLGVKTVTHWTEHTPLPTKVMVIGAARFAVKTFADSPQNLPVSAWVYPQDSTKGFYDYALATQILNFFSNYIAPFPYPKLANVQSTTIFGGMENASCIFYAESSVTGDRRSEALLAHEIVHQWFGNMASEKSFAHLWLSEGFATYLTHLYYEQKHSKETFQKRLQQDREEVIHFARKTPRPIVDSTDNLMSLLNANSYQKGGWVLHMLRNEVGDKAFHQIVQTYYNQFKGSNAETRDFQAVAEKVSGKDLNWFFNQWLYRPGVPKLKTVARRKDRTIIVTITQVGELYKLPFTIRYSTDGKRFFTKRLLLDKKISEFQFEERSGSRMSIEFDPDKELLYEAIK